MEEEFDEASDGGSTPVLDEPDYDSDEDGGQQTKPRWQQDESPSQPAARHAASDDESGPASPDDDDESHLPAGPQGGDSDSESVADHDSAPASPDAESAHGSSGPASPAGSGASPASPPPEEETSVQDYGSVATGRREVPMSPASPRPDSAASPGPESPASPGLQSPASPGLQSPASPGPESPASPGRQSPASSGRQSPSSPRPRSPSSSGPQSPGRQSPASPGLHSPTSPGPESPTSSVGAKSPPAVQSPASNAHSNSASSEHASSAASSPERRINRPALQDTNVSDEPGSAEQRKAGKGKEPAAQRRVRISSTSSEESAAAGGSRSALPKARNSRASAQALQSDDEDEPRLKPASKVVVSESDDSDFEAFEETDFKDRPRGSQPDGGNDDASDKESAEGDELIADIFGSSDEEFEGFVESEVKKPSHSDDDEDVDDDDFGREDDNKEKAAVKQKASSGDEDSDIGKVVREKKVRPDFVSDFDEMMKKKKEDQAGRRRKRKNVDIINDNDDLIVDLIKKMKEAAEGDRTLNENKQPAVKKLKLLPLVVQQLNKAELQSAFLDCGVLGAITEWLAPLPDKSLPHLQVREALLKILALFPTPTSDMLKSSGTGKAIMYLYKHPRETRRNKEIAGKLVNEWSRPIFGHATKYMSRDEREQRDYQHMPKRRKSSNDGVPDDQKDGATAEGEPKAPLRPGDVGWISRARVPAPSTRDYVVRPKWNVEEMSTKNVKKGVSRYEKQKRVFQERKKVSKQQRAITISIEGRNMAL